MTDDVLVRTEGVSKKFCRDLKRSLRYGVQDTIADLVGRDGARRGLRPEEFWAVDDVSFELRRGECLGLVGRNGAGKTTLLKMFNGLIKPDRGRIEMRGRVAALIALGAGFNPILTGRENVYINGAVLGLSKKEIDAKYDEIVEFAEIGEFINAPVQSYSSGMHVRLGFAVAAALNPDVLLLDEVLAVGDAAFRARCYRRVAQMRSRAAVILVSHAVEHIAQFCSRGMVLQKGSVAFDGYAADAIEYYGNSLAATDANAPESVLVIDQSINNVEIRTSEVMAHGGEVKVNIAFDCLAGLGNLMFRTSLWDASNIIVTEHFSSGEAAEAGRHAFSVTLTNVCLKGGLYRFSISVTDGQGAHIVWSNKQRVLEVRGPGVGVAAYAIGGRLEHAWRPTVVEAQS